MALMQVLGPGDRARVALRPENVALSRLRWKQYFPRPRPRPALPGTQTIYGIDLLGHRLKVLELGTAACHEMGAEVPAFGLQSVAKTSPGMSGFRHEDGATTFRIAIPR
jgi:hypothetical protein